MSRKTDQYVVGLHEHLTQFERQYLQQYAGESQRQMGKCTFERSENAEVDTDKDKRILYWE